MMGFAPAAWRDVDTENPTVGFHLTRHGVTFYVMYRSYRLRWWLK